MTNAKFYILLSVCLAALLASLIPLALCWCPEKLGEPCCLEVKYVIYDIDSFAHIEVVGHLWVNGAIEYNNKTFRFGAGQEVSLKPPDGILDAEFAYWQEQDEACPFDGEIITDKMITITLDKPLTVWWANYSGDLSSLVSVKEME